MYLFQTTRRPARSDVASPHQEILYANEKEIRVIWYTTHMGMNAPQTGGCMCGKIRYTFKPPFTGIISCHCKQCQRLHGNYNHLLIGEKTNFTFNSGEENVGWYDSSAQAERGFC